MTLTTEFLEVVPPTPPSDVTDATWKVWDVWLRYHSIKAQINGVGVSGRNATAQEKMATAMESQSSAAVSAQTALAALYAKDLTIQDPDLVRAFMHTVAEGSLSSSEALARAVALKNEFRKLYPAPVPSVKWPGPSPLPAPAP
jgi:hypothetical protein